MISRELEPVTSHPYSARVYAKADDTTWSRMLRVPDEVFLRALRESLIAAGSFSEVVTEGVADYALDVLMMDLRQPLAGFDVTVNVLARWTMTNLTTGNVVLGELIPSAYTIPSDAAFSATERARIATEGAVRANIREGIRRIAALNLSDRQ